MGFTSTEVLFRITNSIAKPQLWKSCCYRHCWTMTSFLVGPRYHQKSLSLKWLSFSVWLLRASKFPWTACPEFKTSVAHFKHLPVFSLMIEPMCSCPETNAAHPSLPSSAQFSGGVWGPFPNHEASHSFSCDCPRPELGTSIAKICWCINTPSLHSHSDSSSFGGASEGLRPQVLFTVGPTITPVFSFSREPGLNTSLVPFVYFHFFLLPIHCLYRIPSGILVDRDGLVYAMVITMQVTQVTGTATHFCL